MGGFLGCRLIALFIRRPPEEKPDLQVNRPREYLTLLDMGKSADLENRV